MTIAVAEYEEKPRESWIFDFPAQVALCGTQIWWTSDVNMAFVRLEEGYENAVKDYFKKQVNVHVKEPSALVSIRLAIPLFQNSLVCAEKYSSSTVLISSTEFVYFSVHMILKTVE